MSATDRMVERARGYVARFGVSHVGKPGQPATGVAVLACMDCRIDVYSLFGLQPGDAHVIRNAGGLVTNDSIRSLVISQRELGTTEIVLVHHTRCGMQGLDEDGFAAALEAATGQRPTWRAGGFADPVEDVRRSIELIRADPFVLHKDGVRGFVFDVDSGALNEVKPAA